MIGVKTFRVILRLLWCYKISISTNDIQSITEMLLNSYGPDKNGYIPLLKHDCRVLYFKNVLVQ